MARAINRLTARTVATLREPGMHADGGGLYLRIDEGEARRWVFIFHRLGKRREMGLGGADSVTLVKARAAREEAAAQVRAGIDPIAARKAALTPESDRTFSSVADAMLDDLAAGWRGPKQRPQWEASLKTHAARLWPMAVQEITTEDVLIVLRPIWTAKPETASRVRGRIERVLDVAKAKGLRTGDNPARWRGHLDLMLTPRSRQRGHHKAMPYEDVPAFVALLREREATAALALEFAILTAARSGEVLGAVWSEIKGDAWVIPAERMKAGREHRVPLSARALQIVETMQTVRAGGDFIFPGQDPLKPLSGMSLEMLLRRMERKDATPHGFRSSFRDWAGDCTAFPREIAEAALAHQVGGAVERAYRRGDALSKRRELMDAWAAFIERAGSANVVELRRG